MKKLSDLVIMSDVDGTLMTADGVIPQRNIDAIQRFCAAGGRFGIATGRSRQLNQSVADEIPLTLPCVLYNGGVLYHYGEERFLMETFLPGEARRYIEEVSAAFSGVQALPISNSPLFAYEDEQDLANYYELRNKTVLRSKDDPGAGWYKVLFLMEREELYGQVMSFIQEKNYPGVRFVATNYTLLEMLPEQSSKAFGIQSLMELADIQPENLVAIGDFYNDLEMINLAGFGATTALAPDELKQAADLVVGRCEGGAVADLIEYLENTYTH